MGATLAHIAREVQVDLGRDAAGPAPPTPHIALPVASDGAHAIQWVIMTGDPLVLAVPLVSSPFAVAIRFPEPGVQKAGAASGIAAGDFPPKMDAPPRIVAPELRLFVQPCEMASTWAAPIEGADRVPIPAAVPASCVAVYSGPADGKHSSAAAF